MRIVITGGAGFLGLRLAEALLQKGSLAEADGARLPIEQIVLFDQPQAVERLVTVPTGCTTVGGDVSSAHDIGRLLGDGPVAVFHLASVVSGHGERDFDLALRVNLDGARHLLEACRAHPHPIRLTTTSSLAVFGPASGDPVGDDSLVQPATTYGMTKAMLELMINDYSRKGYLDGRAARLPTVIIRPGAPNAAASSAASAIFREPLAGHAYRLPLDPATVMAVASVESVVDNLITLHELAGDALDGRRTVTFPSVSGTFEEMLEVLRAESSSAPLGAVTLEPDPAVQAIVRTWPTRVDGGRGLSLGLRPADDLPTTVRAYRARYG
ncbi:MAG TPA: D-erythronate dehydrogenase [Microlunatus sp.]|nr:D-erythronate dehydrogenase [Microlunatus sp.]